MTDAPVSPIQAASDLVAQGRLEEAEQACLAIVAGEESPIALYFLGYIAQQSAQYEAGVGYCRRAIAAGGDTWATYLALGACLHALGRLNEAYDALLASSELAPARVDAAALLLQSAIAVHGFDHAQGLYDRLFRGIGNAALDRAWLRLAFENGRPIDPDTPGLRVCRQMRAEDWARRRGVAVIEAGEIEDIPIESPPQGEIDGSRFKTTIPSNRPYVTALPDVEIFSKSHIVLTRDGVALNEAGAHADYGQYVSHIADSAVAAQRGGELLLDTSPFQMRDLEAGIMLCGPASDAFGHWIGEYLPRLQFLEQHPDFAALPIIVDEGMPQSHLDHLAMIASNPLVVLKPGEGLRCGRLLYAPPPTFFPIQVLPNSLPPYVICSASLRAYRFLKQKVEASIGVRPATGGKYYLSRRNRSWRRLRNDLEVTAFLEAQGYRTVMIEDLTFEEQVRLFQDAASIVAPVGSAPQNTIFAPAGVQLIILIQTHLHNHAAFYGQMSALGYRPQFVCGPAVGDSGEKHVDYTIPLDLLAEALRTRA